MVFLFLLINCSTQECNGRQNVAPLFAHSLMICSDSRRAIAVSSTFKTGSSIMIMVFPVRSSASLTAFSKCLSTSNNPRQALTSSFKKVSKTAAVLSGAWCFLRICSSFEGVVWLKPEIQLQPMIRRGSYIPATSVRGKLLCLFICTPYSAIYRKAVSLQTLLFFVNRLL